MFLRIVIAVVLIAASVSACNIFETTSNCADLTVKMSEAGFPDLPEVERNKIRSEQEAACKKNEQNSEVIEAITTP